MKNINKIFKAFTLAELLTCLMVLGIIAAIVVSNISKGGLDEQRQQAEAFKALHDYSDITLKLILTHPENFPIGAMMRKSGETYSYEIYKSQDDEDGNSVKADAKYLLDLYSGFTKFKKTKAFNKSTSTVTDIKLCDVTSCSEIGVSDDSNIATANWFNDVYIALQVGNNGESIFDCPSYYYPGVEEEIVFDENNLKSCWGKLYIDTNGKKAPNKKGQDIFVFGLAEMGIAKK